jgi:quercetin dioxygenase-like cupin family protein
MADLGAPAFRWNGSAASGAATQSPFIELTQRKKVRKRNMLWRCEPKKGQPDWTVARACVSIAILRPNRCAPGDATKLVRELDDSGGRKDRLRARGRAQMLKHIRWNDVELENLNPLLQRQFVVGEQIMVARVLLKKGSLVPMHAHENEQVTYILEGALRFRIDGKEIVVGAGEVLCIPPHMPHEATALEDTVDLDVFTPPRADWISGNDAYLREQR